MSQAMNDLRGSLVALVTPMTASGAIDWTALDGRQGPRVGCQAAADSRGPVHGDEPHSDQVGA